MRSSDTWTIIETPEDGFLVNDPDDCIVDRYFHTRGEAERYVEEQQDVC